MIHLHRHYDMARHAHDVSNALDSNDAARSALLEQLYNRWFSDSHILEVDGGCWDAK